MIVLAVVGLTRCSSSNGAPTPDTAQIREVALANPDNDAALQAFLASQPRFGEYAVIEGDLLMTEVEVRQYLRDLKDHPVSKGKRVRLISRYEKGRPDRYDSDARHRLKYWIDKSSFPDPGGASEVEKAIARAAQEWQNLCAGCGVRFEQVQDQAAAITWPGFTVRHESANAAGVIATAFYPSDREGRRILRIFPAYSLTRYDHTGLMRHELGHVLGYLHEQIHKDAGCKLSPDSPEWHPLTPYDEHSVMHYFCNDNAQLKMKFTEVDRVGHLGNYSGG